MISPRLVLTLVLAACGGKSPPPTVQNEVAPQPAPAPAPPPKSENEVVMEKMRGFTDGMCACKDKVCADKVQEGMSAWAQQVARDAGDDRGRSALWRVHDRGDERSLTPGVVRTWRTPSLPFTTRV
jgi:hypothetical protein